MPEVAEYMLKAPAGSRRGSVYMDISFSDPVTNRFLHVNTFLTRKDGKTPVKREVMAARKAILNGGVGDVVLLCPFREQGLHPEFKRDIQHFIQAVGEPPPDIDPRLNTPVDQLYYIWEAPDD
jgi:hypothetical protein